MNANGTKQRNLTRSVGDDLNAVWQPQAAGPKRMLRWPSATRVCYSSKTGDDNANYLDGTACRDTIKGRGGKDTLIGRAEADWLYGEADPDTLNSRLSDKGTCDSRVDGGADPGDKARVDPCDSQYGIDSYY